MRREGALWLPRRAGGVKDRGFIVWRKRNIRERQVLERAPAVDVADDGLKAANDGMRLLFGPTAHIDGLQFRTVVDVLDNPLPAFRIDDADLGA